MNKLNKYSDYKLSKKTDLWDRIKVGCITISFSSLIYAFCIIGYQGFLNGIRSGDMFCRQEIEHQFDDKRKGLKKLEDQIYEPFIIKELAEDVKKSLELGALSILSGAGIFIAYRKKRKYKKELNKRLKKD